MELEKVINLAKTEMNSGMYEEAEQHFELAIIENPGDIELIFYKAYCKCYTGAVKDMINNADNLAKALDLYVKNILNECNEEHKNIKLVDAKKKVRLVLSNYEYQREKLVLSLDVQIGRDLLSIKRRIDIIFTSAGLTSITDDEIEEQIQKDMENQKQQQEFQKREEEKRKAKEEELKRKLKLIIIGYIILQIIFLIIYLATR